MKVMTLRVLMALLVAGAIAPASALEPTPFQVIPPVLTRPPVAAREPVVAREPHETELIEGDPERKKNRARRLEWLQWLPDYERVDRSLVERPEGVEQFEPIEPAAGVRGAGTVERPARGGRPETIERLRTIVRPVRIGRRDRIERVHRSGRR
jgi:hypothetical protein